MKHLARCDQGSGREGQSSCWVLGAGPWGHGHIRAVVGGRENRDQSSACDEVM